MPSCYISFSRLITSAGEERSAFLLSFTRNFVISVRIHLALRKGCVILL